MTLFYAIGLTCEHLKKLNTLMFVFTQMKFSHKNKFKCNNNYDSIQSISNIRE